MNSVIMGRKTFESIGNKPLNARFNIILSKSLSQRQANPEGLDNLVVLDSLHTAQQYIEAELGSRVKDNYIVGGRGLYEESIALENMHNVFLTRVNTDVHADVCLD